MEIELNRKCAGSSTLPRSTVVCHGIELSDRLQAVLGHLVDQTTPCVDACKHIVQQRMVPLLSAVQIKLISAAAHLPARQLAVAGLPPA
jgi:hypothetical protein